MGADLTIEFDDTDEHVGIEQKIREGIDPHRVVSKLVTDQIARFLPYTKNLPAGSHSTRMSGTSNSRTSTALSSKPSDALTARDSHLVVSFCVNPVARPRDCREDGILSI